MDIFFTEVLPAFRAPSADTKLVIFFEKDIHKSHLAVTKHMKDCAEYARQHKVYLVTPLMEFQEYLCLCLLGPNGSLLGSQLALHLPLSMVGRLHADDMVEVYHTDLGNLALCVDSDIYHPQVSRTAALKGADVVISIQSIDPVDEVPERLMCSVWNCAQSNNVYVINLTTNSCTVACPVALTRGKDGYILRRGIQSSIRFGLNLDKLDEVRDQLQIMENINTRLVTNYSEELER